MSGVGYPAPADYADRAALLSTMQLTRHYGVNLRTVRRWTAATGATPPSGHNRFHSQRPIPDDFAALYATTQGYRLCAHYHCSAKPLARWVAMLTDAERAAHNAAMVLLSSVKPSRRRPEPRVKVAKPAKVAAPKPVKVRRITQCGYGRQSLPAYVPDTLCDRAAQFLRPVYIPVIRGRVAGMWHVGRYVFDTPEMLAFAVKRGFNDGSAWGAGA